MAPMGTSEVRPDHMAPPAAKYAHAVRVDAPASMVFTSGVVPVMPDGTVPATIEGQARCVWANLIEILKASEMKVSDIVSITTYVVATDDMSAALSAVMGVRDEVMGEHRAASTLVTVPALARPEWRMEIALVAAR